MSRFIIALPFMREGSLLFSRPCRFLSTLYQKFLEDYGIFVQIINKKKMDFVFDQACKNAHDELKRRATSALIIQPPN